jgi:hypothetical protein
MRRLADGIGASKRGTARSIYPEIEILLKVLIFMASVLAS